MLPFVQRRGCFRACGKDRVHLTGFELSPSRLPLPLRKSRFAGHGNRGDDITTPLPTNPDIDQLRRQAEELLQQARSGDAAALDRLGTLALSGAASSLADSQRAFASEYGYPSWPCLRQGVVDARGRSAGLRAARPVFDDKTTGGDALLAPSNSTMFTTLDDLPRIGVTCLSPGATAMIGQVENQVALH